MSKEKVETIFERARKELGLKRDEFRTLIEMSKDRYEKRAKVLEYVSVQDLVRLFKVWGISGDRFMQELEKGATVVE